MVGILLNGTLALVELDAEPSEPLGGARRWPIHWDDLRVYSVDAGPANAEDGYRLGLSGLERDAVQHAVPGDSGTSLCGEPGHPPPICGWSLPFSPGTARACPACVRLAAEMS
ncbi:hypothetical protein ACGFI3_06080 [Nonomuraea wenchangensis]|uniref:hypothetical protein n=1 Tax=Nonomuraea wenchangensis TaxID=568860 RepID=UPI0037130151